MEEYADGTKKYIMQRERKQKNRVIPYPTDEDCCHDDIRVFVLFSDKDQECVDKMQNSLKNKKITLTKGLAEAEMPYGKKRNIINKYDYVVVIVSKNFLQELDLLDILPENYQNRKRNKKILPVIIWEDLYEPECRDEVFNNFEERINAYRERHKEIISNLEGNAAKELRRMQSISLKLQNFTYFAVGKDVKANLQESDKLLKYILHDRNVNVADRENSSDNKGGMSNPIINVKHVEQLNIANDNGTINATTNKRK